ncbi:MAG: cyclase family protein [Nanoarchaeota archaeon]|nr:cyclase family protein [Nanoarchaeota archaeon]
MVKIYDISVPIFNGMWSYRDDWKSKVERIASTNNGDKSTVYRFDLCSHTGTYIETTQHKLKNDILLSDFSLDAFHHEVVVLNLGEKKGGEGISLSEVKKCLEENDLRLSEGSSLIVAVGWGQNNSRLENFVKDSPYFERELTDWLASLNLHLLGVDVPVIDNQKNSYNAVNLLFEGNEKMLLLAPLSIDLDEVKSEIYTLSAMPLISEGVCASLCRAILIKNPDFS